MKLIDFLWNYIEKPKKKIHSFLNYKLLGRSNKKLIQKEVNKYRNQLMLDSPFSVIKLLGWTDQYEEDYYWVVQERKNSEGSITLYSCVGGFIPLKKKLRTFEYLQLVNLWNLNMNHLDVTREIENRGIILK